MSQQAICLEGNGVACAVDTAKVVGNVLAKTNGFDWVPGEIARADESLAQVEKNLGRPGALGIASVPESGKK